LLKRGKNTIYKVPKPTELIPDNEEIISEAIAALPDQMKKAEYIEKNFYKVLKQVMDRGYKKFLKHQEDAKKKVVEIFNKQSSGLGEKEKGLALFELGIEFEKSASQMRKARAGQAFENYVQKLLEMMKVPCEKPMGKERGKLNRTDLVVPDKSTAFKQPDRAKFLSMKTTLAERWKQVVPEQNKGWAVYLLTLDEKLSKNKAREIEKSGIVLFVPDEVKSRTDLKDINGIRSLSDLPEHLVQFKKP